ncbi:MAG: transporter [Candidatus Omnitrophica bacterium]|nr:transporter [Candidatus Omnitrophota bacterium]
MIRKLRILAENSAFFIAVLLMSLFAAGLPDTALAAEGGSGLYLLGYRVLLPGIMPEPGLYLRNDFYWYDASAGAVITEADEINLNGDLETFADLITVSYVLPALKILDANYSIALIIPMARAKMGGDIKIAGQIVDNGVAKTSGGGDLCFTPASFGWHWNDLHCIAALSMFFPTGEYSKNKDITIGKNRFALDPNVALTWLDTKRGHELSAALGYTVNRANRATDYKTGDELHLDFTAAQHFPCGLALGAGGYYYQQITGDSGDGALMGSSRGRVVALGPVVSYSTKVKGHDIGLSFKYFREFADENRWAGNAFFLTLTAKL